MVACVTAGLTAPGVQRTSARPSTTVHSGAATAVAAVVAGTVVAVGPVVVAGGRKLGGATTELGAAEHAANTVRTTTSPARRLSTRANYRTGTAGSGGAVVVGDRCIRGLPAWHCRATDPPCARTG